VKLASFKLASSLPMGSSHRKMVDVDRRVAGVELASLQNSGPPWAREGSTASHPEF
jgi:hypothetical protein